MEDKRDAVTKEHDLPSRFVQHTLQSWRFFLLCTIPPMVWVLFAAQPGVFRMTIALLCGVVGFGCWRLWLDAHYLSLINDENNTQAGKALWQIWQRQKLRTLSRTQRQQGALAQCRRTLYWVAILWLGWLLMLLFY